MEELKTYNYHNCQVKSWEYGIAIYPINTDFCNCWYIAGDGLEMKNRGS